MKERVKVKKRSSNSRASPMNTAEQANRTKPERKLVSFASNLMILANKAVEDEDEDESLPADIEEDTYAQTASQRKRKLMMQQKAKTLSKSHKTTNILKEGRLNRGLELYKTYYKKRVNESLPAEIEEDDTYAETESQGKREQPNQLMMQRRAKRLRRSHKATNILKEARLDRGLELYKIYKKRVSESDLGACRNVVGNNLCGTLEELLFGDLVVLATAASIWANESKEVVVPVGVEEHTCKQRESGDMDCGGSCFGLSENRELMQEKGEAAAVNVVEEVKPNRDLSDGCREDKLFGKKYVRRKREKNKDHLETSTSVGAVAGTSDLVKELCRRKPSSLLNVDAAEREEGLFLLYNSGETQSKSEQGCCSKAQGEDETQVTAAGVSQKKMSECLYSAWERGYPKQKRSQLIREPKKPKKKLGKSREGKEQVCDHINTCHISGKEAEKEDLSGASNFSSSNPWSSIFFNVQWRNKKKRNCLKTVQNNRKILLLAVEAIAHQFCRLKINKRKHTSVVSIRN